MWCWRRTEKIIWTDRVRNEVLHRVKEMNILCTLKRRKGNWIGHTLRRNCLIIHVIEGRIGGVEVTGRLGRRRKQIMLTLGNERVLQNEIGSTRSNSLENSFWSRLWTCRNEWNVRYAVVPHCSLVRPWIRQGHICFVTLTDARPLFRVSELRIACYWLRSWTLMSDRLQNIRSRYIRWPLRRSGT